MRETHSDLTLPSIIEKKKKGHFLKFLVTQMAFNAPPPPSQSAPPPPSQSAPLLPSQSAHPLVT